MVLRMSSLSPNNTDQRIVFLDRDGVINRDSPDYIKSWREFDFLPRSIDALKILKQHAFRVFVVSNQSAVNRRMLTLKDLRLIHDKMTDAIAAGGGSLEEIFFCPHLPQENCRCRKPKPGMLFAAQKKYGLSLSSVYMVGDRAKDVECAKQAACGFALLVKSNHCTEEEHILQKKNITPDYVAEDLFDAAEWIIAHRLHR